MAAAAQGAYSDHITRFITRARLTESQTAEILLPYLNACTNIDRLKTLSIVLTVFGVIGTFATQELLYTGGILGGVVTYGIALFGQSFIQERATNYVQSALRAQASR